MENIVLNKMYRVLSSFANFVTSLITGSTTSPFVVVTLVLIPLVDLTRVNRSYLLKGIGTCMSSLRSYRPAKPTVGVTAVYFRDVKWSYL